MFIYRYEDESKGEVENDTNHFSELLKRIEDRKRQRAAESNKSKSDENRNNLEEPKKKKKKKLHETEKTYSHIENKNASVEKINEQTIETVKVSTKKKKNKKKDVESKYQSSATNENIDLEEKDKNLEEKKDDKDTTEKDIPLKSNFIVLGAKSRKKQREVKTVLPDWLAHPEVISANLNSGPTLEESELFLDAKLVEVLRTNGIVKLFPVQSSIIKWLHKCKMDRKLGWWPRDTCVSAPTGSGKYL